MSNGFNFKWFSSNVKVEHPDGVSFNSRRRDDGSGSDFFGVKSGVSANYTFMKLTKKISDDIQIAWNGANLGASFGTRVGNENAFAAMIEPSLGKTDLSVGPVCASIGFNANTGVKLSEEGFKVSMAGFGVTMGIGGKFSFDTPFGSAGISSMDARHTYENYRRECEPQCNVLTLTVDWSAELDPNRFERERKRKLRKGLFNAFAIMLLFSIVSVVIYNYTYSLLIVIGHGAIYYISSTEFERTKPSRENFKMLSSIVEIVTYLLWVMLVYDLTCPLIFFICKLLFRTVSLIFFGIYNNIVILVLLVLGVIICELAYGKNSE